MVGRSKFKALVVTAAGVVLLACISTLSAQQITRYTIDSGGGRSSGGGFVLEATVGQPDAATLNGGVYRLRGGFWSAVEGLPTTIFANGFE